MAAFRAMALFDFLPQMQQLADPAAAGALFAPLAEEQYEVAAFVYLDEQQRVLGLRELRSDARDTFALPIREIVADALKHNASGVVMAHNHPSGDPMPSPADCEATRTQEGPTRSLVEAHYGAMTDEGWAEWQATSARMKEVAAKAPASWATIKAGASAGLMPANVSLAARASVTAGFAKDVEAVNQ